MVRNPSFDSLVQLPYNPSPLSSLQKIYDDDGNLIRVCSDVEIIRNGSVNDATVLSYVKSLEGVHIPSDGQDLDSFIETGVPKGVQTITDAYQYGKYLASQKDRADKAVSEFKDIASQKKSSNSKSDKTNN